MSIVKNFIGYKRSDLNQPGLSAAFILLLCFPCQKRIDNAANISPRILFTYGLIFRPYLSMSAGVRFVSDTKGFQMLTREDMD